MGREGEIVGARQLKERLMREKESNISMRINETEDKSGVKVAGRGVLHLSVLMETMRREGFEFQVGRPQVVYKIDEDGSKSFDYAGCLECGTCRIACEGTIVKKWENPQPTMGVEYRFG